jgi:hypothetical protein
MTSHAVINQAVTVPQGNSSGSYSSKAGTTQKTSRFSALLVDVGLTVTQKAEHGQTVVGEVKVCGFNAVMPTLHSSSLLGGKYLRRHAGHQGHVMGGLRSRSQ